MTPTLQSFGNGGADRFVAAIPTRRYGSFMAAAQIA